MIIDRTECPQITDADRYDGMMLSLPEPIKELTRFTPPKEDVILTFGDELHG